MLNKLTNYYTQHTHDKNQTRKKYQIHTAVGAAVMVSGCIRMTYAFYTSKISLLILQVKCLLGFVDAKKKNTKILQLSKLTLSA